VPDNNNELNGLVTGVDGLLMRAVEPLFRIDELDNWVSSLTGALLNTSK
jgi:hypothetical protein